MLPKTLSHTLFLIIKSKMKTQVMLAAQRVNNKYDLGNNPNEEEDEYEEGNGSRQQSIPCHNQ